MIASELLLNGVIANDIKSPEIFPKVLILPDSIRLELPLPVQAERQKFIVNVSSENGFVCHNFLREKEIKDKLFSLQTKSDSIPELEKRLLEKEKPVNMIESSSMLAPAVLGFSIGLISSFFIMKK